MSIAAGVLALVAAGCGGQASAHSSPPPAVVYKAATPREGAWNFASRPDLHPARLSVTSSTGGAAPGSVFVTPGSAKYGETGPLILDSRGNPVWVGRVPAGQNATNFRVQTYQGKPVLTWWQGKIVKPGYGDGVDVIANSSYHVVARVQAANGLKADAHDFTITPQGYALITAYAKVPYDLSSLGGSKKGMVLDSLVQVIDIRTGRLLFQWDPLKQVPLTDSYMKPAKGALFDPYHVNSVALDGSGHLMISARHTWTVYNVDTQTGRIVWRMGGKHSDLTLGTGVSFAWQHSAIPFGSTGDMVLFDNAAAGTPPHVMRQASVSSALVLHVDEASRTVTLIHKFTHPGVLATSQGSVQALPNGDFFVGWGAAPNASEYTPNGTLVWDAHFYKTDQSYRAFKMPWTGRPTAPPALVVTGSGGDVHASMSWNGATGVARWQVLAGRSRNALKVVATVPRSGFETTVTLKRARFYEVRPLATDGHALSVSAVVPVTAPVPTPSPSISGSASPLASPAPSASPGSSMASPFPPSASPSP